MGVTETGSLTCVSKCVRNCSPDTLAKVISKFVHEGNWLLFKTI